MIRTMKNANVRFGEFMFPKKKISKAEAWELDPPVFATSSVENAENGIEMEDQGMYGWRR